MQLAQVRDPAVGAEVGPQIDHGLNGLHSCVVQPQFDLGVADHSIDAWNVGMQLARLLAKCERFTKLVPGQCQGALAQQSFQMLGITFERFVQHSVGLVVKAGIAGFASALEIRPAEQGIRLDMRGPPADPLLQRPDHLLGFVSPTLLRRGLQLVARLHRS